MHKAIIELMQDCACDIGTHDIEGYACAKCGRPFTRRDCYVHHAD